MTDTVYSVPMLRNYWNTLLTVFTSPTGYRGLLLKSNLSALGFFCLSIVFLSLSQSIRWQQRQVPLLQQRLTQTLQELQTTFPPDFQAVWNGEELQLDGLPVTVKYPSFISTTQWQLPSNLATIDSNNPSPETLDQSQSLFYLSENQVYAQNSQQEWVEFPIISLLQDQPSFTLNQETLPQWLGTLSDQLKKSLKFATLVVVITGPVWLILARLWEVFFNTLFLFFFFRLDGRKWPWRKTFQLGLYLAIPAEFIHQVASWLYPHLSWSMFNLSFWILAMVVYLNIRSRQTQI